MHPCRKDTIFAADFFTTEVWTAKGLITHYTLFAIHHATRAVHVVGTTVHPCATFMDQCAKQLTDPIDGFLRSARFLIIDRDSLFSAAFRATLKSSGVRAVRIPASSPNCNSVAERWIQSARREALDRMIFFGTASLDRALAEYGRHYNSERNHQSIGNEIIAPTDPVGAADGPVRTRERLGGLLKVYYRRAG